MSAPVAGRSRIVELSGTAVHYVDFGGRSSGPSVVLVHGLGGSHLNWDLLAPRLSRAGQFGVGRVYALDLPGFGLSPPTGRPATVRRNLTVLTGFIEAVAGAPVVLVGNSMGGLISVLLASGRPDLVGRLVLLDPALPVPGRVLGAPRDALTLAVYALPGVGERLRRARRLRIGAPATVRETLQRCGVDEATLPGELLERSIALVDRQSDVTGMDRAFLSASRSLAWALARSWRYQAAMSSIRMPVLLLHGVRDLLVPVGAARVAAQRHPTWRYVELPEGGHLPQLQLPEAVAAHILDWLMEVSRATTQETQGTSGEW